MKTGMFMLAAIGLGVVLPAGAADEQTLCVPPERIVFSCVMAPKMVSLCGTEKQGYVYRYGRPGKLELVYPAEAGAAPARFESETFPVYGGAMATFGFRRGPYTYRLYSRAGRSEGPERVPESEDGLQVLRSGKMLRESACDDSGPGFREALPPASEKR